MNTRLSISSLFYCMLFIAGVFFFGTAQALTIQEKKEQFLLNNALHEEGNLAQKFNKAMLESRKHLEALYEEGGRLLAEGKEDLAFSQLAEKIIVVKDELSRLRDDWKKVITFQGEGLEADALWHSPEITVSQLIMEYGKRDKIYLIPDDVGKIKLSLLSEFPVPCEAWSECLSLVLNVFGIGAKELNPFVSEIYFMTGKNSGINVMCNSREALSIVPPHSRACFVLSGLETDLSLNVRILRKFARATSVDIEHIAGKVFICGPVHEILELLKFYDFASANGRLKQDFRLINLCKTDVHEIKAVLQATFKQQFTEFAQESGADEKLIVLSLDKQGNVLFLSGPQEYVDKAAKLIKSIEEGMNSPTEKTIFWYKVKHSDPEELATLLSKVHSLWNHEETKMTEKPTYVSRPTIQLRGVDENIKNIKHDKSSFSSEGFSVNPGGEGANSHSNNTLVNFKTSASDFVVDTKTGTLVMVTEKDKVSQIRSLLKKLDIPKRMINIEVLLFERKVSSSRHSGMNLLRLGDAFAKGVSNSGAQLNGKTGILDFVFSKAADQKMPAYDLAYQFLMSQEDIQINASPSIMTLNRTPATIAIVEEISIAIADISGSEKDSDHVTQFKRAQYGITIRILPTINSGEKESDGDREYVLLDTDITFDTTQGVITDRPDVTRRHITNQVRIANGETVILGGLRRKSNGSSKNGIPFLGDIPGLGKLFGMSGSDMSSTEMFVFITPKIIPDAATVEYEEKMERYELRHGDGEELAQALVSAKERYQQLLHEKFIQAEADKLLLKTNARTNNEYDGQS
ncbi:type II secretion system protein GspD [Candidatus Clavichlamydia salmonicola]|uniref:type II secretion system protein GspD n=1 Tax=Candidatus Clavichlamydia salmonicola TaxID=469812 RepID=UPI001890B7F2|nr:type II secretion system protein GspD [Candidatus Clavichlamydia salmonicola]